MAESYSNPFQGIDVTAPVELHEIFRRYCQTGSSRSSVDLTPFPRMIDLWFLAVCVAANLGMKPAEPTGKQVKIIEGHIFLSDPSRITLMMLIAMTYEGNEEIVTEPRKVLALASGLAIAGIPKVVEMMKEGGGSEIWNLSEAVEKLLTSSKTKRETPPSRE